MKKTVLVPNEIRAVLIMTILMLSLIPIVLLVEPGLASSTGPSLVVDDAINRINATVGVKSGSVATAVGTVTNIGPTSLSGLLTAIFIREDAHGLVPSDITGEWSPDGVSWSGMAAAVAPASAAWDVELTLGPIGGYPLAVNGSSTTYIRLTAHKDVGTSSATPRQQTVAVFVYKDNDSSYSYSSGDTMYSQSPDDYPVKIDLEVVHTAEIEGTGEFYYSIQDAVNAVASTTVILYPGTYSPFTVSGKSSLTIVANGAVVVKGSQSVSTNYANRDAVIFVEDSTDVTLDGLDIEGEGLGTTNTKNYGVIFEESSGTIKDCIISPNTIGDMYSTAIGAWDGSDLTVDPCTIENFGRIGVFYFNGCTGGVYDSTIIGQVYSDEGWVNYGIEVEGLYGACDIEIVGNEIYNCDNTYSPEPLWSSAAIMIDGWMGETGYSAYMQSSTVEMEGNDIHDNYYGIEVVANSLSYAHHNDIHNNREYGVISEPDEFGNNVTFDARFNWWGSWLGPFHNDTNLLGFGNGVTDNVTYSPWLEFVAGTTPMTYHVNPTGKIQDAIDDASSGDTILVHDGTYNEALYIDKTLTIKAFSKPVVKGSQSFTTNYMGSPFTRKAVIFVVNSTNVVLEGLDIEGEGLSGYNAAVVYMYSGGEIRDCTISPNTVGDMYSLGVEARGCRDLSVSRCTIMEFGRIGAYFANCTGGVYDSEIIGQVYSEENKVNYGIEVEPHQGACVMDIIGNEIYNSDNTYSPEPLWSSAGIVIDGWKYYQDTPSSTVVISYNDIHDNYHGIEVAANSLSYARCNKIYDNREYGVISTPDSFNNNVTFNAVWNWWGSDTGPYHPTTNPGGTGDEVSDYVDYEPWKTKATLKVEPTTYQAKHINETFSINVTINNLSEDWKMVSVQFRLSYNSSLLEVLDVTEGPFMNQAGLTLFIYQIEDDGIYGPHVLVGILLMPQWTTFPHGSGTLATITFNATYCQREDPVFLASCDLTLVDTILVNSDIEDVLHDVENGHYEIECHICDLNMDGRVDMRDIAYAARAFGAYPSHPRWDPVIDINGDGMINMRDIAYVARHFGWDC